jgi:hypothetical protein
MPVGEQLGLMQFRPGFDHSLLPLWQCAGNKLNRFNSIYRRRFLIIGVEMGGSMVRPQFNIHSNDNPEKAAQFRHGMMLSDDDTVEKPRTSQTRQTASVQFGC